MRSCLVTVALVSLAGCSSGGTPVSGPSGNGPGPGGGGTPAPTAGISVIDYEFSPATTSVKVGTVVTWTNNGAFDHTATADAGAFNSGQLSASSGGGAYGMSSGGTYSYTFSATGTFNYHCANHAQMTGTITVTP